LVPLVVISRMEPCCGFQGGNAAASTVVPICGNFAPSHGLEGLMRGMDKEKGAKASPRRKAAERAVVRIGISGWTYGPWRGVFYPEDLTQKNELAYASKAFSSIEINGTFYSLQKPESFQRWAAETPED